MIPEKKQRRLKERSFSYCRIGKVSQWFRWAACVDIRSEGKYPPLQTPSTHLWDVTETEASVLDNIKNMACYGTSVQGRLWAACIKKCRFQCYYKRNCSVCTTCNSIGKTHFNLRTSILLLLANLLFLKNNNNQWEYQFLFSTKI